MERLVALTEEHADLSREVSSNFPLRALVHPGEATGQLLFDGVVRRFESAQSQFRCQIVHRYFTGSIFASKPVPDCADPAVAQLPNVENNKAPPTSQIVPPLLYAPALEECMDIRFGASFALFICHLARLFLILQVRPRRIVPCLAAARMELHRIGLKTPKERWMCLMVIGHISLVAGARFGLRLSRTVSANGKPKHHKIVSVPCLWAEVATLKFNPDLGR